MKYFILLALLLAACTEKCPVREIESIDEKDCWKGGLGDHVCSVKFKDGFIGVVGHPIVGGKVEVCTTARNL